MANNIDDNARIRLDTPSLEARAALYPEELRDPFLWLGRFLDDECARDIDILVKKADLLGVHFDKTTWSRVLRGRWNRDAQDELLDSPIVALPKLLKAIAAIRKDAERRERGGGVGFVATTTTRLIENYLKKKWTPDRLNRMGVVIGETGNQKTATFRQFQRENNHGMCVWLDAPETPSLYKFKTDLAGCYGGHPAMSLPKKEALITNSVNERKMIILENVQRLWDDKATTDQPVFSYLQKLNETKGCAIILSFTPVFERKFSEARAKGFLEQFEGRVGGQRSFLRLPEFPPEEDVLAITKAYGLRDAEEHVEYCHKLTREPGRIRILFETLQDAKIRAEYKKEALEIKHLRWARDEK